jgi:benzoyl-CoA-dihydrodiol lyase
VKLAAKLEARAPPPKSAAGHRARARRTVDRRRGRPTPTDHVTLVVDARRASRTLTMRAPEGAIPRDVRRSRRGQRAVVSPRVPRARRRAASPALRSPRDRPRAGAHRAATPRVLAADEALVKNAEPLARRRDPRFQSRVLKRLDLTARASSRSSRRARPSRARSSSSRSPRTALHARGRRRGGPQRRARRRRSTRAAARCRTASPPRDRFLASRLAGDRGSLAEKGPIATERANEGLVTIAPDEIDWDDEVRIAIEERASSRPTRSRAWRSLRFAGPETHGLEDLRPPQRLAELDLPAPQRGRRAGRPHEVRPARPPHLRLDPLLIPQRSHTKCSE